jgi:hypothetical protein
VATTLECLRKAALSNCSVLIEHLHQFFVGDFADAHPQLVEFHDYVFPVFLMHEGEIWKRIMIVPLITRRTHGVTISEIKADDEIAAGIEMRALEVSDRAAGNTLAVTSADDARGMDV